MKWLSFFPVIYVYEVSMSPLRRLPFSWLRRVRKLSGKSQEISLRLSQSLKEVRKKGNFNRTCLHFADLNRVISVEFFFLSNYQFMYIAFNLLKA